MAPSSADRDLIAQCLGGSDEAWCKLVGQYSNLIYSMALKYGLSHEDAADVFQNVCLFWWQSLNQVEDIHRLSSWLITVTGRTAWGLIEGRRRVRQHEGPLGVDVQEVVPARGLTPEEVILAAERSIGLRQAVNRLDERCRRLIIMLFFAPEPPDYAQIAREFGLAEGSIGALRKRCLERLRQEIIHKSGERRIF
jgi:RNA polymerase sigma factor (sigma-70 family)